MSRKIRPTYINYTLVRVTALIHLIVGSIILVLSGVILFALPAFIFYVSFLVGFYFFLPGVVITFGLINKNTARSWARYMLPLWKLFS